MSLIGRPRWNIFHWAPQCALTGRTARKIFQFRREIARDGTQMPATTKLWVFPGLHSLKRTGPHWRSPGIVGSIHEFPPEPGHLRASRHLPCKTTG